MKIHVGYIPSHGKIPSMKKEKDQTWDDVMLAEPPMFGDYMGVLDKMVGFVDTDTPEDSERLLEWSKGKNIPILQTDKGYHAYFTIPKGFDATKNGYVTPLGIRIDWRVGADNCRMDCLKNNGRMRYWIKTGELVELPKELRPIYKADKGLCGLGEGGRDNALFNHFNKLLANGFEVNEFKTLGDWINQYVLAKPYESMYKFSREEQYTKLLTKLENTNKKLQLADYVNLVFDKYQFKVIDGLLHYYKNGVYTKTLTEVKDYLININGNITEAKRNEVFNTIIIKVDNIGYTPTPWYYIPFNNGYLNLKTMELKDYNPEVVFTKQLRWNWNPTANSQLLNKVMSNITLNKPELEVSLYEMVGYALLDTTMFNRAFMLIGNGSNGKSIFLDTLEYALKPYVSSLGLSQCTDRFSTILLYNTFANICNDISSLYQKDTSILKCLTDGNAVKAEQKNQPAFSFNNTSTLIFSCNDIPKLGNGTDKDAIMRRLQIIPFNAKFKSTDKDYNPFLKYEMQAPEVIESLLVRGVMAIKNTIEVTKDFTMIESIERDEYEELLTPFDSIIAEVGINGSCREVYDRYRVECYNIGVTPLGLQGFYKEMRKRGYHRTISKVGGKTMRHFHNI